MKKKDAKIVDFYKTQRETKQSETRVVKRDD